MLYILCVKRNSIARNRQFYNLVKREGVYNVAIETKLFRLVFSTDSIPATSFLKLGRGIGKLFLHHVPSCL